MKLKLAAVTLATALIAATSAVAGGGVNATLENPVAKRVKLIAADAVWVCEKDACVSGRTPDGSFSAQSCQELARQVGRVSVYQGEFRGLTAAELDKCNSVVRPAH
jgi:hypothetical protein